MGPKIVTDVNSNSRRAPTKRGLVGPRAVRSQASKNTSSGAKVSILPKPESKQPKLILQDPNLVKRTSTTLPKGINNNKQQGQPKLLSVVNKSTSGIKKTTPKVLPTNSSALKKNNQLTSLSNISMALQTAKAIATNLNHPKQSDVSQLIVTYEKGWIDNKKFVELLRNMLF